MNDNNIEMLILVAEGSEELETLTMYDVCKRAEMNVRLCSISGSETVTSSHGVRMICDCLIEDISPYDVQAVYLPGGLPGAYNLAEHPLVLHLVQSLAVDNKLIAAICAAPYVLQVAGLSEALKFTCFPAFAEKITDGEYVEDAVYVVDENYLTGMGPAASLPLALKAVALLKGEDTAAKIAQAMQIPKLYEAVRREQI